MLGESRRVQVIIAGIEVELVRKRIKHMHLRVYPPKGIVRVSAPLRVSSSSIEGFVASKAHWIRKHQARIESRPDPPELTFEEGEKHGFLGELYVLRIQRILGKSKVEFGSNLTLSVQSQRASAPDVVARLIHNAYRSELQSLLDDLVPKWEERMGVKSDRIRIRRMRRKWGACRPFSGDIVFNLELVKYPKIAIEYVVLHELAHLIEPSHNSRFQGILTLHMPNWRTVEEILNEKRPIEVSS